MEWHIVTGSKGGTGKTLLSLLLLGYHLDNDTNGGTLVLDLNGMNTDTSAILLYKKKTDTPVIIPVKSGRTTKRITIQKTYSLDSNNRPNYYLVGQPVNPFELYDHASFADLLTTVKTRAAEIQDKLNIPPLKHVIIDTNYHFCNIFPYGDRYYKKYTNEAFQNENIEIWFLWVYRQLSKLIKEKNSDEAHVVKLTASAIERNLKDACRIIHTFTPVALTSAEPNVYKKGVLTALSKKFYDAITQNKDCTINELEALEKLPVGGYIPFGMWVEKLDMAHIIESKRFNDDPRLLFVDVLTRALQLTNQEHETEASLPINIVPLSVYQHALQYYTDKERDDAVANLRKLTIYKNFSRLMRHKDESRNL